MSIYVYVYTESMVIDFKFAKIANTGGGHSNLRPR